MFPAGKPSGRSGLPADGRYRIPVFELLELRAMLSTTTVTDFKDDGAGSLRAAITASNSDPGGSFDTIDLNSGTYNLTIPNNGTYDSTNVKGDLDVTNTNHRLIIIGQGSTGPNATIIDQTTLDRVFAVAAGADLLLEDVEVTGGTAETDASGGTTEADGGGILNLGGLTLQDHGGRR